MNYLCFISFDSLAFAGVFLITLLSICKLMDFISSKSRTTLVPYKEETPEERSRRILGNNLYETQLKRLQDVILMHETDNSIIADLTTCFGISKNGQKLLTTLLPGDKVYLSWNKNKGLIRIEKNGLCIGHVSCLQQHEIRKVIETDSITGVYIHTQNSYGMYPRSYYLVDIIVYYKLKS